MADRQYAHRDIMALDKAGGYYWRHVSAMTGEGLHSKSDIAAELAWRDAEIDRLASQMREHEARVIEMCAKLCEDQDEPPYYGYENPNTFNDGKWACAAAIRRSLIEGDGSLRDKGESNG